MNDNQLARLNVQIKSIERNISQVETQFGQATGVNKTKLASKLTLLKTRLAKLQKQYDEGSRENDKQKEKDRIAKETKENKALKVIKEDKTKEKVKVDASRKQAAEQKIVFNSVSDLRKQLAEATEPEEVRALKAQLDEETDKIIAEKPREKIESQVSERFSSKREEVDKNVEEGNRKVTAEEDKVITDILDVVLNDIAGATEPEEIRALRVKADDLTSKIQLDSLRIGYIEKVGGYAGDKTEEIDESVEASNLVITEEEARLKKIEDNRIDEEGTLNINEAGIMEVVKDGQYVPYTGPYTKADGTVVDYTNGIAVGGAERVKDSEEFGREEEAKLKVEADEIEAKNTQLKSEIFSIISSIRGFIGQMDSAATLDELDNIWTEINTLIADVVNRGGKI